MNKAIKEHACPRYDVHTYQQTDGQDKQREDLKGSVVPTGSHKTNTVTLLCTGYTNQAGYRGSEGSGIVRDESLFFVIFS